MTKKLIEKWVKALRSGKYKQGQMELRNPVTDSYCCLGVLCEVAGLPRKDFDLHSTYGVGSTCDLEHKLDRAALGVRTDDCRFKTKSGRLMSLVTLNDSGKTFKQIALYIERYWEQL